jgi:hypothetical protein
MREREVRGTHVRDGGVEEGGGVITEHLQGGDEALHVGQVAPVVPAQCAAQRRHVRITQRRLR